MIHPAVVYDSQEDHALYFPHLLAADLSFFFCVHFVENLLDVVLELVLVEAFQVIPVHLEPASEVWSDLLESVGYPPDIPFFGVPGLHDYRIDYAVDQFICHVLYIVRNILTIQHHAPLIVDDLALLVHYIIVLQHVFTYTEVFALDFLLSALYRSRKHSRLERLVLVHAYSFKYALHPFAAEKSHQVIFECYEELRVSRVSLTS